MHAKNLVSAKAPKESFKTDSPAIRISKDITPPHKSPRINPRSLAVFDATKPATKPPITTERIAKIGTTDCGTLTFAMTAENIIRKTKVVIIPSIMPNIIGFRNFVIILFSPADVVLKPIAP